MRTGFACGLYEGAWRRLILQAKSVAGTAALVSVRELLLRRCEEWRLEPGTWVVPPPSRSRRWRSWYLPDELAAACVQRRGGEQWRALRRRQARPAQTGLTGAQRRSNLAGSFAKRRWLRPRSGLVYLLDDVVTTGTTLRECHRVLATFPGVQVIPIALAQAREA